MNAKQYADYESAVAAFLSANEVQPSCHGPKLPESAEPFFSWSACECCGSSLGGNRETYVFAQTNGEQFEADICTDCVYYLACDRLDDTTMAEVEASREVESESR